VKSVWNSVQLVFLILLMVGSSAGPARGQSFGPPVPTDLVLVLLDREGNVRFTLSGYYAHWQNPFQVTAAAVSATDCMTHLQKVRTFAKTPASPLFEGQYVLSRRWSVGFWYNPIRGERLRTTVFVKAAQAFASVDVGRNTDLADVHVIYHWPHGLAAQLGYYHESGTYRDLSSQPAVRTDYTLVSWNFWLTQRLDVFTHSRLTSDRLDAHLIPFVSLGYHASSGLNHAASVLTGVAVTFGEKISLSGSVWFFDLGNTATRITGGLVIQY
jgi:hypothetical protein